MGIQILSAMYGPASSQTSLPNVGVDVTTACQNIVNTGNDDIYILPSTFGIQDPDPNVVKTFGVLYTYNNTTQTRFGVDFQTVDLGS